MTYNSFPNTFHNDKWIVTFSNLPNVSDLNEMRYYSNYIKSFTLPDYNMQEIISWGPGGYNIRHPVAGMRKNNDLGRVVIDFKLCEDLRNYLYFFNWMQQLKYGALDSNYNGLFRLYTIKSMILSILDNKKRTVANIYFSNVFLLNLSSLSLQMGNSTEVDFSCNFSYEEIKYECIDPTVGSSKPTSPTLITPCSTSGVSPTTSADWI